MKMTRGQLKQVIAEEINRFIESTKKDLLKEGNIKPEQLRDIMKDLEDLERQYGQQD